MKAVVTLSLAAAFAIGLAASAQAWQLPHTAYEDQFEASVSDFLDRTDWHKPPHCVGLASGTAHASCGTATGGPSGGLF